MIAVIYLRAPRPMHHWLISRILQMFLIFVSVGLTEVSLDVV